MTPAEIIDALGGALPLSRRLGIPSTTIGNWRSRNSIPARYHQALVDISDGYIRPDQIVAAHNLLRHEAAE